MAFTFDVTTSLGQVRLLIPDRDVSDPFFQDDEINVFLSLESADVRRATALALETIASDTAMTLKVIRLLDLTTDGAKTSAELRARAKDLRAQADAADLAVEGAAFDIAEMVPNSFAWRERIWNEALRDG